MFPLNDPSGVDAEHVVADVGRRARAAGAAVACASTRAKDAALGAMARSLLQGRDVIRCANLEDVSAAHAGGVSEAFLDRLSLDGDRVETMVEALLEIATQADPVGRVAYMVSRPNGMQVGRMRVPIGVICLVYEARPNVTAEAAGLALKSGNALILRGGSEAVRTNIAIARCLRAGLAEAGLPVDAVQLISTPDRAVVRTLACASDYIDLIIPRGGRGLIESLVSVATVPLLKHLDGNCHVYIDRHADPRKAERIVVDAKTQRLSTCNTAESLLIHEAAADLLPALITALRSKGIEVRGCPRARAIRSGLAEATLSDFSMEYLGPIISIKVVGGLDEAIEHINVYGSGHSDTIVTDHLGVAQRFLREVNSSSVMVNASTRLADGREYGLGAEIGISTDRLHARGPVGAEGLTTEKWIVIGDGHTRA